MRDFIASYLSFTRKERNGIITVLIGIVLLIFLPFIYPFFIQRTNTGNRQFENEIAALQIKKADTSKIVVQNRHDDNNHQNYYSSPEAIHSPAFTGQMFYFDPNTLSTEGWKKLGIQDKTIQTIQKYLSRGGKFYQPEDIEKIWGLRDDETERLKPYIQIQLNDRPTKYEKYEKAAYEPALIDINSADTTALIALPGIGSKLAQRIITFREKLGGFYKPEQVAETFGLPDSIYQKIKPKLIINNSIINQLDINTATIDQLKAHPYIRYNIANIIIQYRNQHGNFNTVEDIKKIMLIDEETYNKINRYLKVNNNN